MTSLLVLATFLLLGWLWIVLQRSRSAASFAEWSYVPLVGALTCLVMALGLWLR